MQHAGELLEKIGLGPGRCSALDGQEKPHQLQPWDENHLHAIYITPSNGFHVAHTRAEQSGFQRSSSPGISYREAAKPAILCLLHSQHCQCFKERLRRLTQPSQIAFHGPHGEESSGAARSPSEAAVRTKRSFRSFLSN